MPLAGSLKFRKQKEVLFVLRMDFRRLQLVEIVTLGSSVITFH